MAAESTTTAPTNIVLEGNPAALGLPVFIAASIALGLALLGYVPGDAGGAPLSIIAAAVGQSAVASILGVFAGFWLSYALLVFGLLTIGTLHLPLAFTAIFALVDLALVAVLIGTLNGSSGWLKLGGIFALLFAAMGAWVYVGVISAATGGESTDLGRPVLGG